jgi:hypothetical protein
MYDVANITVIHGNLPIHFSEVTFSKHRKKPEDLQFFSLIVSYNKHENLLAQNLSFFNIHNPLVSSIASSFLASGSLNPLVFNFTCCHIILD